MLCFQEMVSESTTKTVLTKLLPNTRYSVTVVPVYAEGDGPSLSDSGKTSEYWSEPRAQRPLTQEKKKPGRSRSGDKDLTPSVCLFLLDLANVAPEDASAQT